MPFTPETLAKARATRAANAAAKAQPAPVRARAPRIETNRTERRRRKHGTLDRMAQYKLDIFSPDQLDTKNYVYRWVSDESNRLRMVTRQDDYDYVDASEIHGFNAEDESDSEGGERIRMIVGERKNGQPTYAYLLKKSREFWEEDNRIGQDYRDGVLQGRVYTGEADDIAAKVVDADGKIKSVGPETADTSNTYVPPEASLLHGITGRRRGLVQPQPGA